MYQTRDSIDQLTELGENKEAIVALLEKLAELGWIQSHWVKYRNTTKKPFIEIYGDLLKNAPYFSEGMNSTM